MTNDALVSALRDMAIYSPRDWYWYIGDDKSQAYSSKSKGFIPASSIPDGAGTTTIANEVELYDVLAKSYPAGKPSRSFTVAEVRAALLRIDASLTANANDEANLRAVASTIGFDLPETIV